MFNPLKRAASWLRRLSMFRRGEKFAAAMASDFPAAAPPPKTSLEQYFDANQEGPGLWKWRHYFEIYERHFGKFVGRDVHVVEVGVYSGGSLPMWQQYFGPGCRVYGVDIEDACRGYEGPSVRVFVGDQADRAFWRTFRGEVPRVDIFIDDGGHTPQQQRVTLEEMLPHLAPGGVYLCEDIHAAGNEFAAYVAGLCDALNQNKGSGFHKDRQALEVPCSGFQRRVHSIHHYPFATVIEVRDSAVGRMSAPKHGTQWQPFYNR